MNVELPEVESEDGSIIKPISVTFSGPQGIDNNLKFNIELMLKVNYVNYFISNNHF